MDQPSLLVIDDEPENFDVLEALLHDRGYQLHYASSGQEAIDSMDIFQPDVILLDVMMPELDGIQVCQRIKAMVRWQTVPILMVTALTAREDLARCLQAGADDFVSKPINSLELRARLQSMLRIKHMYGELERQVEERTSALKAKVEQERLITKIATQIRSSLKLQEILDTTVHEVRSLLPCDRAMVWQLQPDWQAHIVAEATHQGSFLGHRYDLSTAADLLQSYQHGQAQVISDVEAIGTSDRHRPLLAQLQIRATIWVPIMQGDHLWGLISAADSQSPRSWAPDDIGLLQQLATHLAIAIQQANAYDQVYTELAERQRAESHLRASEQRYAALVAAAPVGIFHTDAAGNCLYVNQRWCSIAGCGAAAVMGNDWVKGLHPDDRQIVAQEWICAVQESRPFRLEYRFQRPDGDVIWVFGQAIAEYDADAQITGYVGTITDISPLKQAQELIVHNLLHDPLTDLPNRTLLLERLDVAINRARHHASYLYAVLFIDLDRFKVLNDSLGHGVGDQLLTHVAQKLKTYLRPGDLLARFGGDEFVILLEELDSLDAAIKVTEAILADCQIPVVLNGYEMLMSASIGIVPGTKDYHQASDLLRDADIAMYRAKAQGRSSYKIFDAEMHAQALSRLTLESEIRKALEREEFVVYYQPVVDILGDRLVGFEALVRWQHPTRGFISPADFIPIAEETGLIVALDSWMFYTACQQLATWKAQYAQWDDLKISINLSTQDLHKTRLLVQIDRILAETGLSGDSVALEITESMLIEDIDQTIELLTQLKARKIQISIDDFGTGYSSLNYLHRLPADNLKIDRSFVGQMQEGNRNYQVVSTIIALSNQLGLDVVAEGIETPQQLAWLQQMGCELGQGYLFAKPLSAQDIETRFLRTQQGKPCPIQIA